MMGGLDWIQYRSVARVAIAVAIGGTILLWLSRDLNAMAAGGDSAASVGTDARRVGGLALGAASLMVGAGIAIAGPIGFIGLMVPHALRALIGPDHRLLLPTSMFVGGAALVVCDTVARIVIAPAQLPVGVVTALFGGPFFLYLLLRSKSRARLWGG
jgi:iron complex transport system permease protein